MIVVVKKIMMVPMKKAYGTARYTGLLVGQWAGYVLGLGIFGLPPITAEQHNIK